MSSRQPGRSPSPVLSEKIAADANLSGGQRLAPNWPVTSQVRVSPLLSAWGQESSEGKMPERPRAPLQTSLSREPGLGGWGKAARRCPTPLPHILCLQAWLPPPACPQSQGLQCSRHSQSGGPWRRTAWRGAGIPALEAPPSLAHLWERQGILRRGHQHPSTKHPRGDCLLAAPAGPSRHVPGEKGAYTLDQN